MDDCSRGDHLPATTPTRARVRRLAHPEYCSTPTRQVVPRLIPSMIPGHDMPRRTSRHVSEDAAARHATCQKTKKAPPVFCAIATGSGAARQMPSGGSSGGGCLGRYEAFSAPSFMISVIQPKVAPRVPGRESAARTPPSELGRSSITCHVARASSSQGSSSQGSSSLGSSQVKGGWTCMRPPASSRPTTLDLSENPERTSGVPRAAIQNGGLARDSSEPPPPPPPPRPPPPPPPLAPPTAASPPTAFAADMAFSVERLGRVASDPSPSDPWPPPSDPEPSPDKPHSRNMGGSAAAQEHGHGGVSSGPRTWGVSSGPRTWGGQQRHISLLRRVRRSGGYLRRSLHAYVM
jgi:hypothetical protein